jgi:hypothetical protein
MTVRAKRQPLLAPTVISKYLDNQKYSPRRLYTVYPFNDNILREFENQNFTESVSHLFLRHENKIYSCIIHFLKHIHLFLEDLKISDLYG